MGSKDDTSRMTKPKPGAKPRNAGPIRRRTRMFAREPRVLFDGALVADIVSEAAKVADAGAAQVGESGRMMRRIRERSPGAVDAQLGIGVLQGRPAEDIIAQMEAFRSGARPATLMNRIVRGFSPSEVEALATWFATP